MSNKTHRPEPSVSETAQRPRISRREMLTLSSAAGAGILLVGCGSGSLFNDGTQTTRAALIVNPDVQPLAVDVGQNINFLVTANHSDNSRAAYWGTQESNALPKTITQSLSWSQDPTKGVRVQYDARGLPIFLLHEENGAFLTIFWEETKATFKLYQPSGQFIGGSVVTRQGDTFAFTQLAGSAIVGYFSGELNGLQDGILSFTVGGGVDRSAPTRSTRPSSSASRSASHSRAAQNPIPIAKAYAGVVAGSGYSPFAKDLLRAIREELRTAGQSLLGANIFTTALTGTALTPLFLESGKPHLMGLIAAHLLVETASLLGTRIEKGEDVIADGSLATSLDSPLPTTYQGTPTLPTPLPAGDHTGAFGIASSRELGAISLTGIVDASNRVSLSGTSSSGDTIELTGQIAGENVSGQWTTTRTRAGGSGSWGGKKKALGQCTVQQNSGNQGIFTNTYDLGSCGTFDFEYETYVIPDHVQVFFEGKTIFDTGGPVAQHRTVSVTAIGQSTLVTVVVTAPLDGTAWYYNVGCPK